jgi:hypothetical protein
VLAIPTLPTLIKGFLLVVSQVLVHNTSQSLLIVIQKPIVPKLLVQNVPIAKL